MDEGPLPRLDGVTNFRELGGLAAADGRIVSQRRLFRSGHWANATESDRERMRDCGIRTVFDFRSDDDIQHEGADRLPDGVELVRLPTFDPAAQTDLREVLYKGGADAIRDMFGDGRAHEYMRTGAARLVTERTEVYSSFLDHLSRPDPEPALFHCSAGKDRAGWAASTVLLALGVAEPDVVEHYLLSNTHFEWDRVSKPRNDMAPEIIEMLTPLARVESEYVEASFAAARDAFGSIDGYLQDALGLDPERRRRLRDNWLGAR